MAPLRLMRSQLPVRLRVLFEIVTNGDIAGATTIMSAVFEATVVLPLRVRL